MPIIERGFLQLSDEWFSARAGNPGVSNFDKIVTMKGEPSKSRKDYMLQMASEKIRGKADETFKSQAMENGTIREAEARALFELLNDIEVEQVAMVYKDEKKLFHASPDGLIGKDGGIEIKCPLGKTHANYLYDNKLPSQYYVQLQSSMYVCERKYWWFMSYVDGLKPLFIRVERDEVFLKALKIELEVFCVELNDVIERIK